MSTLICPICRGLLQPDEKTWRCSRGHSFDVAREGYLNLLAVQHKKSLEPGDNPEMVKARLDFLQAGHYEPLRKAVVAALKPLHARNLLDIGCGEGYYTSAYTEVAASVIGIDIAKIAVQLAAKRFSGITWLVAGSAMLPVADASQDIVTSLFSPQPLAEMVRVLKPGGSALVVTPAHDHLWELRQELFDEVRAHHPEKFLRDFEAAFAAPETQELSYALQLEGAALKDLMLMTPYAWRATAEKRAALALRENLETKAAFTLFLFRKKD